MISALKSVNIGVNLKVVQYKQPNTLEIRFIGSKEDTVFGKPGKKVGDLFPCIGQQDPSLLVSLGSSTPPTLEQYRVAGSSAAKWMIQTKLLHASLDVDSLDQHSFEDTFFALCEGILLGVHKFTKYTEKSKPSEIPIIEFVTTNNQAILEKIVAKAEVISRAVILARDLAHEPANVINPITLAEKVIEMTRDTSIQVKILDDVELERMGAHAIVAVGKGSSTPSRMIVIESPPQENQNVETPVLLIGKALTFDTGGYSLKAVESIVEEKYDKCGGINVLATILAAYELGISTPLVGIIGAAENMISSNSYRPDDIITTLSGKTVEVITTDAEGRLVLADCLTYGQRKYQPKAIIDLATLTGGIVTALGHIRAGIFSNNENLSTKLFNSGEKTHELLWRMPLDDEYFYSIRSEEADLKNSGGKFGHPIFGGLFLKQFVEDGIPWAHLDIAGTASMPKTVPLKEFPYYSRGATGFGVRLLIDFLSNL